MYDLKIKIKKNINDFFVFYIVKKIPTNLLKYMSFLVIGSLTFE